MAAALVCGIVYFLYSFPSPDWLDSPELVTASVHLGLFHPPGSPLAVLLGHALSMLPFGNPGQNMLYFSAIWAGVAVYVISRLNQLMWTHFSSDSQSSFQWYGEHLAAPAMAVATGLAPGLLSQSVRTEVYTLGLLLALLVIFQAMRIFTMDGNSDPKKPLDLASLFTGMGLAVHPLVALSPVPLFFLSCLRADIRGRVFNLRTISRSLLLLSIGAAPLALLGLMLGGWADLRWGDPTSLGGWLSYISGATFSPSFSHGPMSMATNLYRVVLLLLVGTGWPLFITGLLGLYAMFRMRTSMALGLLLIIFAGLLSLVLQRSFRLDNPDATGYALVAMVSMGILANVALVLFSSLAHKRFKYTALSTCLLAGSLGTFAFLQSSDFDRSSCENSEIIVARTLRSLPKNSLVLLADFNLVFMMDFMTKTEGVRPDITILYLRDLDNVDLRAKLKETHPKLAGSLPSESRLSVPGILKLAEAFPLAMDLGPHFPVSGKLLPIRPAGLLWLIKSPETLSGEDMVQLQKEIFKDIKMTCNGTVDSRTADVLAWHGYFQATAAQDLSILGLAKYMIGLAAKASPEDKDIVRAAEVISR